MDPCYYNFTTSELYHYNSPIPNDAITIVLYPQTCHFLRLRRPWAHMQTSVLLYKTNAPAVILSLHSLTSRPHMSSPSSVLLLSSALFHLIAAAVGRPDLLPPQWSPSSSSASVAAATWSTLPMAGCLRPCPRSFLNWSASIRKCPCWTSSVDIRRLRVLLDGVEIRRLRVLLDDVEIWWLQWRLGWSGRGSRWPRLGGGVVRRR